MMNRGDVVWHKFRKPDKTRPVLVSTRNDAIPEVTSVTVIPITTTIRNIQPQVVLTEDDGLREICAINADGL